MRRERPTAVLVMAILNLIFGSMGFFCYLCAGGSLLFMFTVKIPNPPGMGTGGMYDGLLENLKSIPGYWPITITTLSLNLALAIALVIAGIGLLRMKPWARWTCVVYSIVDIVLSIFSGIYTFRYVNPVMLEWQQEFSHKMHAANPAAPDMSGMYNLGSQNIQAAAGVVLGIAYAIALLIVMFLPSVSAAFAGRYHRPVTVEEDYYDDVEEAEDRP
jgi:hypothetical protein